ncbi:unnamed protein product, partial [Didymodactylos carnosus]
EYATAGSDRRGSPWCSNGQVTPGSSWTIGAKYNYPERNCCACKGRLIPSLARSFVGLESVTLFVLAMVITWLLWVLRLPAFTGMFHNIITRP